MNAENNHRTQFLFNRASENAYEDQETPSTINKVSDFFQADDRLLPYHLYLSSKFGL